MINTILFDLDGTLLSMDTEEFTKEYFKAVAIKLKDYLTFEEVFEYFWQATKVMIENVDSNRTNENVFFEELSKNVEQIDEINKIIMEFYASEFDQIKGVSKVNPDIVKSVAKLKEKGYDLVIATNPLFPIEAVYKRIEWAQLNIEDFIFITSFEHMHFTKPHLGYYKEILTKINKKPSECLMVGNDVVEDMVAKKLAIKTYLITDHLIGDLTKDTHIDDWGSYKDFYNYVESLPSI